MPLNGAVVPCIPTAHPSVELTMKIELRMYDPDGGVTVFHEPPVKCKITGQGVAEHVAVVADPPPTVQTSPVETMKTENRSFAVPNATPFVHMNPFQ
jgi:hypothetical protein